MESVLIIKLYYIPIYEMMKTFSPSNPHFVSAGSVNVQRPGLSPKIHLQQYSRQHLQLSKECL